MWFLVIDKRVKVSRAKPNIVVRISSVIVQIDIPDTGISIVIPIAARNQAHFSVVPFLYLEK